MTARVPPPARAASSSAPPCWAIAARAIVSPSSVPSGFKVRDGIAAGLSASKTTAYVAANVDAMSQARPKDKPLPYRLLAIYEQVGAAWQIVALHFSVVA